LWRRTLWRPLGPPNNRMDYYCRRSSNRATLTLARAGGPISAVMRPSTAITGLIAAFAVGIAPAAAAPRHQPAQQPGVVRSASGTIIQPTTTIIPDGRGHVRVIVIPRQRSYLDLGTEVSVGDRSFRDYVVVPGPAGPIGSMVRIARGPAGILCQAPSTAPGSVRKTRSKSRSAQPVWRYAASRSSSPTTALPISSVLTTLAPSDLLSAVRRPLASAAAIAASS